MRAVIYNQPGPSSVFRVAEIADPVPGVGEVRVRVHTSGVNPTDWKQRAHSPIPAEGYQIPNQDGAGVIDAVGPGVDPARLGQRVWVYFAALDRAGGTAAELVVLPIGQAVELPDNASFELGASLGIPALTSHRLLFADGSLDGRTVLVAGGAGAVGRASIQLAAHAGAHVITTVSSDLKADIAAQAGAHHVINYRTEDAAKRVLSITPGGVDRIIEVAPSANSELDATVLRPGGVIAIYANDGPIPVPPHMHANSAMQFVLVYTMGQPALTRAIEDVTQAVARGTLDSPPTIHFTLEATAAAHDAVESGATGKAIIDVHSTNNHREQEVGP